MNARQKLNIAHVNGALVIAGIVGLVTQSWFAFFLILAGGVLAALYLGNIRPSRQP